MGNCLKKQHKKNVKNKGHSMVEIDEIVGSNVVYPDPDEVPAFPWINKFIYCKVYEVHDGDTVKVIINHHDVLFNISIRVQGIDTPEISRCTPLEQMAGLHVTEYVKEKIEGKIVRIYCTGWDKFGGRIDGFVFLGMEAIDNLTDHLIEKKYAKPYTGKSKKESWTDEELRFILAN